MSWMEAIDARINPVLIKEVRQSLRSRLFRVGYLTMLIIATMAALAAAVPEVNDGGKRLFGAILTADLFTVCGLIPFYLFFLSPGEGQARAQDLVMLSGLSPFRLVMGRVWSALAYIGLVTSALLPFLALSVVLPGVDLRAGALLLAMTLLTGLCMSAAAIALGALIRSRMIRAFVGLLLSGVLFYVCVVASAGVWSLLERPDEMLDADFPLAISGIMGFPLLLGVYGVAGASAALSHPEENRSTPLRVATLGVTILCGLGLYFASLATPRVEDVAVVALFMLSVLGVPVGVFLVEPDPLGRRVEVTLPRSPLTALLIPLLPGGQRAILFGALLLAGFVAWASYLLGQVSSSSAQEIAMAREALWTALAYGAIYLLVPALICRPLLKHAGARIMCLVLMPGSVLGTLFLPMFIGLVIDDYGLREGEHLGNAIWFVARFFTGAGQSGDGLVVQLVGLAALVASLPRAARGVSEVLRVLERPRERA